MRRISLLLVLTFALGGCGHNVASDSDNEINVYPANYKSDILAAMHAYLNDPTGIRDAAISEPALKSSGNISRYIACVRFTPKKNAKEYAGPKEIAAVFLAGRFDRFIDTPKDECAGVPGIAKAVAVIGEQVWCKSGARTVFATGRMPMLVSCTRITMIRVERIPRAA